MAIPEREETETDATEASGVPRHGEGPRNMVEERPRPTARDMITAEINALAGNEGGPVNRDADIDWRQIGRALLSHPGAMREICRIMAMMGLEVTRKPE
jgi:hypothetical protein